jgi:hypothetical protein
LSVFTPHLLEQRAQRSSVADASVILALPTTIAKEGFLQIDGSIHQFVKKA